jgi:2-polyprenyl-6-methoxyphenol hydroxylase-like FAD-dependent oxidoreductase
MLVAVADVLVVGAGPSGLFSAIELARHGVQARVIERNAQPHHQARATALQPGTLELLSRAGLMDAVLAASEHLRYARVLDANLGLVSELDFAGTGCKWEFQCSLPQWRTEEILADRLRELGIAIERGVAASSIESRDGCLQVTLEHVDGTTETAEAAWVVGAGGAHSVTRRSMAQELAGGTYPGTALVADVRVRGRLSRDGSALIASEHGYVLLAPLPQDRWITFIGDLDEGEVELLRAEASPATVRLAMGRRLGDEIALEDVAWASTFQMHHMLAPRLAGERRFLLGDAGHLSSPFGGEGLNSGLHDCSNLGWKLALAVRGRAHPGLLNSFELERRSADRHVLEVSDQLHGLAHAVVEAARTGIRAAPPSPGKVAALARSRCMLDVSYASSPLVGEHIAAGADPSALPAAGARYPDRAALTGAGHHLFLRGDADERGTARVEDQWTGLIQVTRAADGTPSSALLIRPDGHVGFRAAPADAAGLEALDAHLRTYMLPG